MAKQINRHIKLSGTIDDISFYKSQDGYLARGKGGVSGDRIKNDPKFLITRLNGLEFGAGGKAGKAFRRAFKTEIKKAADNRLTSRVTQQMVKVLKTDTQSVFGQRKVVAGNLQLLHGMELNLALPFDQAITVELTGNINRVTGQVAVNIPALTPANDIEAPTGTSHYSIFAAVAAVDFDEHKWQVVREATLNAPWDGELAAASTINLVLPPNNPLPLFLVVGIEFMVMVNGELFPQSKAQSAGRVIAVDQPAIPI